MKLSPEKSARALKLFADGYTRSRIAELLDRPRATINSHILHFTMTPEQRVERRTRINIARRDRREQAANFIITKEGHGVHREHPCPKPPEEVLAERDRRFSRPINIRNDFLGEPEPGRSALDKKMAEMTA